jgi:RNA polymerase sigma-70 factor, ECF subfamily
MRRTAHGEGSVNVHRALGGEISWVSAKPADDDLDTIRRIASGDRHALAELHARHRQTVFRYVLQLTPDRGLAEEILQDTLVAVWKGARTFEGRSSVRTWLLGIARRQAHNALRQRGLTLAAESELADLPARDPEPEAAAIASAEREELVEAFGRLGPVHREVLVLILVDDLSYQEAAAVLGVPIGTVKSRLSNARSAMRALLQAREGADR